MIDGQGCASYVSLLQRWDSEVVFFGRRRCLLADQREAHRGMSRLGEHVRAARRRLAEGHRRLQEAHRDGMRGRPLCGAVADLRDRVVLDLFRVAIAVEGMEERGVALVAHGGYGRRDVAPFSDIDLMLLYDRDRRGAIQRLAERLFRDLFDTGLVVGHSVRTAEEACRLAIGDATVCTSLVESRLLVGDEAVFAHFWDRFSHQVRRRSRRLLAAISKERLQERARFGETVYLLEPHVKRSRGGLRDVQLVRWIGMVRYGWREPQQLAAAGVLAAEDCRRLEEAAEFLLWLRNELHFHAGRASDVLSRDEQLRIAERLGYQPTAGLLPVEQFMRDYFRHTGQVSRVAEQLGARAVWRRAGRAAALLAPGPRGIRLRSRAVPLAAAGQGRCPGLGDLTAIMDVLLLAARYGRPIAEETWEHIHQQAAALPAEVPGGAWRRFRELLDQPAQLGDLLRKMHEACILERFIPPLAHARGLLQFNQYHKYTVDEHCLRAVEQATQLASEPGLLGRLYRSLRRKYLLHLALLIHDLGKGYPGDHRDVGLQMATRLAEQMGLADDESETLKFLVHEHLLMDHLAFRRDMSDQQLVVRFALQVGSPEVLGMLFLLTACDLAAVGPGAWTGWKADLLGELYGRAIEHLADESPAVDWEQLLSQRRRAVREALGAEADQPWFARQIASLSPAELAGIPPRQLAVDLRRLHRLPLGDVHVEYRCQPDGGTIQFTVSTSEQVTAGIFHKLTGALTSKGLEIIAAQIHTFSDGLVLDRFQVIDPDYAGMPPPERLEDIRQALRQALLDPRAPRPTFRRLWQKRGHEEATRKVARTRVQADNSTSERCTILDIFAVDRPGLLYEITRTLFELGLSVWRAKVGTYFDQVVDAFYVTDREGNKIEDEYRLQQIRTRLLKVILRT